ncbi:MAG: Gfo/Idh/MocA family protein [Bacteroidales bacterium]
MKQETLNIENKTIPRLAFVGTGWIGINRMQWLLDAGLCQVSSVMDISRENAEKAAGMAGTADISRTFEEVVESRPDGIVIATPSALHALQSITALEHGIPVFCQKPLARTAGESRQVIEAAQRNNCLLGVDMSYRFTHGIQQVFQAVQQKQLGHIFAADLVFHNAYGPDKDWFYNPELAGGGCLIDLGIHLLDLAMWIMDYPEISHVQSGLFSGGRTIANPQKESEDYVTAQLITGDGSSINLSCSWNLPLGKDAEIKAAFYGEQASAIFTNTGGSFFNFETRLCRGTQYDMLSQPPDDWGGRALASWARRLQTDKSFNTEILDYLKVAAVIDRIYDSPLKRTQ